MSDPVLVVGIVGLAVAILGPMAAKSILRLRGAVPGAVDASPACEMPSRHKWTDEEIAALWWSASRLTNSTTIGEFVTTMKSDDMAGETCVLLMSPSKESAA